jgi:hypothetical protein
VVEPDPAQQGRGRAPSQRILERLSEVHVQVVQDEMNSMSLGVVLAEQFFDESNDVRLASMLGHRDVLFPALGSTATSWSRPGARAHSRSWPECAMSSAAASGCGRAAASSSRRCRPPVRRRERVASTTSASHTSQAGTPRSARRCSTSIGARV